MIRSLVIASFLLTSSVANSAGTDLIGFGGSSGSEGRVVTRQAGEGSNGYSEFKTSDITAGVTPDQLLGSSFINMDTGWAVGRTGAIIKVSNASSDDTMSLVNQTDTDVTSANLQDVHFINSLEGWASGTSGTIIKTTDGGTTWVDKTSVTGTTVTLRSLYFKDSNNGVAVGQSGTVIRTTDGGDSWSTIDTPNTHNLNAVSFISGSNTGFAVGGSGSAGSILKTTDFGQNWSTTTIAVSDEIFRGVNFRDSSNGIVAGGDGTVLRTTDGGDNWGSPTTSPNTSSTLRSAVSISNNGAKSWVVGDSGTIFKSTDDGDTWSQEDTSNNVTFNIRTFEAFAAVPELEEMALLTSLLLGGLVLYRRSSLSSD